MKLKNILAGVALAAATTASMATPINVGGVTWDPDSVFDFLAKGNLMETAVDLSNGQFKGYGIATDVNDTFADIYCTNCQLTFTFDSFTLAGGLSTTPFFVGGLINIYVQDKSAPGYTAYNSLNGFATAGDGQLWLSLAGHIDSRVVNNGPVQFGTLFATLDTPANTLGTGTERGSGGGLFDVVGGLAADNFDTNGIADSIGGFADINFTSSFLPSNPASISRGALALSGTGTLQGNSIPEPGSLALLGLGLAGLGFAKRRRNLAK